jgi:putrescine---pyruvate transaminase
LMEKEGLVERVRTDTGPYLAEVFAKLAQHPLVGRAETCGMVGGLLLLKDKVTGEPFPSDLDVGMMCRTHCFDNGLIMRAVGNRMIIAPPLIMQRSDIDELSALITLVLDKTLAQLQAAGQF